ncbi:acyl-CoA thioesterase [Brevundimonas goettingensis]|uniref:Thioesterase family protein n=1 Tax=Brevundimonas goettingensis TaxID=2774190 RepID=A0A975BYD5_9CAUL|nr:thioesterase family protein [Brevundimonas goettingensis]QTC89743.1 thioesterase family protein [Brevundimonas goettingensis]
MTLHRLAEALTLSPGPEGLTGAVQGDFSNGPSGYPPEKGFPFGGLLAGLTALALRQGLELTAPLRSLSIQYLSAPAYDTPIVFAPRILRAGRSVAYAALEARQGDRLTHHAQATYGADDPHAVRVAGPIVPPPPLDGIAPDRTLSGPMAPHFAQHVEYRLDTGPSLLQGLPGHQAGERLWMRTRDGAPLDEVRLCYLMDALYPPAWTAITRPAGMATVDLRYDFIADPTPDTAPHGWAFFEFSLVDLGGGWTVDDLTVRDGAGNILAVGRQRRKLAPARPPRGERG